MRSSVVAEPIDQIEQELLEATQFLPEKKYRKRQDYLAALMRVVCDLSDSDFDRLSDEAADWSCKAVDAFQAGKPLPDFEGAAGPAEKDSEVDETDEIDTQEHELEGADFSEHVGQRNGAHGPEDGDDFEADSRPQVGKHAPAAEVATPEEMTHEVAPEEKPKKKGGRPKGKGNKTTKAKVAKPRAAKETKVAPVVPETRTYTKRPRVTGVNAWGVLKGSKSDTVCQMLARENGATMEEIKEITGHYHYNLCNRLKRQGFNIQKDGLRIRLAPHSEQPNQ